MSRTGSWFHKKRCSFFNTLDIIQSLLKIVPTLSTLSYKCVSYKTVLNVYTQKNFGMNFNLNQSLLSGIAEEVSEFNPGPASQNEPRITSMITNLKGLINGNSSQQFTTLTCRSIRVGSYKILTKERVFFTEKAIYLKVCLYLNAFFSYLLTHFPKAKFVRDVFFFLHSI